MQFELLSKIETKAACSFCHPRDDKRQVLDACIRDVINQAVQACRFIRMVGFNMSTECRVYTAASADMKWITPFTRSSVTESSCDLPFSRYLLSQLYIYGDARTAIYYIRLFIDIMSDFVCRSSHPMRARRLAWPPTICLKHSTRRHCR